MTKAVLHPSLRQLSGAMGEMVFRTQNGKTVVAMKSHVTQEPSLPQTVQRKRFQKAVNYAKMVLEDETKRGFYEALAKQRDIPAFALSVADFLNGPTIEPLDLSAYKGRVGDLIGINVTDNVGVVNVSVELCKDDGSHIETGTAVDMGGGYWVYTATVAVALGSDIFIEAQAVDRPGNSVKSSANPIVGQDE